MSIVSPSAAQGSEPSHPRRCLSLAVRVIFPAAVLLLMPGSAAQIGPDHDGDGIVDADDNCPRLSNTDQTDENMNGLGDLCEERLVPTWNLNLRTQGGQITLHSQSDFTGGMGMPLASGDFNDDGLSDLFFAPFNSHQVKGWISDGMLGREISFNADGSAPPGWFVIRGAGADFLGCEIDTADVNGDGIDDLLMGESHAPAGSVQEGGVLHVLFGGQPIPSDVNLAAPPPGLALARIEGVLPQGHLGCWIASADVNGDGIDDILTTASDASGPDGSRSGAGVFYLVLGGDSFVPGAVLPVDSVARLTVHGADSGDRFGSQSVAGDFDGDGALDLLISAAQLFASTSGGAGDGPSNQRSAAGEAVILFGTFEQTAVIDLATNPPVDLFTIYGPESSSYLGEDVGSGDLDGDGVDDLILGAVGLDNFDGATYALAGGPHLRGATIDLAQPPAGVVAFTYAGEGSFLGDTNQSTNLNADRFDELLIGGPESFSNPYELFVLYGNSRFFEPGLVRDFGTILGSPALPDFPMTSVEKEFFETAYTVTPGGDVDGDGVRDAVFNALDANGMTYVIGGAQLSGITDADGDGALDNRDNCDFDENPGQEDTDGDGVGDVCDGCPTAPDPTQSDSDGDGIGDGCDNCAVVSNSGQRDVDGDGEGDVCDLNDGRILFTNIEQIRVEWQDESGFTRFNLYRGDLETLRSSGDAYTQDPASLDAEQFCGTRDAFLDDGFIPQPGTAVHYVVTGISGNSESSLGFDSSGTERPNLFPCN